MSYGLIDYNTLKDISDSIRFKTGSNRNYYPRDMARAINQIKTGDSGFDEPTVLSLSLNRAPYPNFNYGVTDFEFINSIPENSQENGSYILVEEDCSIAGLSPDKVSLYFHPGPNGTNYAFYVDGNRWAANQVSILDMSYMFNGSGQIRHAFCGKFTSKMANAFYSCYSIPTAVCGDYVTDMSGAYYQCSNIRNGVCGNNVRNMSETYYSCSNLTTAVIGPNVENLFRTFSGCYQLTGDMVIPSSVKCITNAFESCNNLNSITGDTSNVVDASFGFGGYIDTNNVFIDWNNFTWENVINATYLFNNKNSITDSEGFLNLVNAAYMFNNCVNLRNVKLYSTNIINIYGAFSNCRNLTEESYNNIINLLKSCNNTSDGRYLFTSCNFRNVHIIKEMGKKSNSYYAPYVYGSMYASVPVENVTWDNDVTDFGTIFSGSGIMYAVWPENAVNALNSYQYCPNLITAACGPLVTNMYMTYYGCNNLMQANIGDNVTYAYATYMYCNSLVDAVCGNNVITMQQTYSNCPSLINAACSDSVVSLYLTYSSCRNLQRAVIGNNATNVYGAYQYCSGLEGDIEIPNESLNIMAYAFQGANNLQNIVIKSKSIPGSAANIQQAFNRTYNYIRRNIVLTNLSSYTNFTYRSYNVLGNSVYLTSEMYDEPVQVNVNGVNYSAVRCSYNSLINTYVYCTE